MVNWTVSGAVGERLVDFEIGFGRAGLRQNIGAGDGDPVAAENQRGLPCLGLVLRGLGRYRLHVAAEGDGAQAELRGVERIDRQRRFDHAEAILGRCGKYLELVIARNDFKLPFVVERVPQKIVELLAGCRNRTSLYF
jgi:hypothetical protein